MYVCVCVAPVARKLQCCVYFKLCCVNIATFWVHLTFYGSWTPGEGAGRKARTVSRPATVSKSNLRSTNPERSNGHISKASATPMPTHTHTVHLANLRARPSDSSKNVGHKICLANRVRGGGGKGGEGVAYA